jgi:hypothetical protein
MRFLVIICLFGIILSCKKDQLKDEKAVLIGTWNWSSSDHSYGWCENETWEEVLNTETEDNDYSLVFLRNGKVNYLKNDTVIESHRLVFYSFDNSSDPITFTIYLDNNQDDRKFELSGEIHDGQILKSWGTFPFTYQHGCEQYISYFEKI